MADPNYNRITPPDDKPRSEYTYRERRAEIYEMMKGRANPRELEKSQRQLAAEYDVAKNTIQNDLDAILDWAGGQLGHQPQAELHLLRVKAVEHLLAQEKYDKAYYLMKFHYELLMDADIVSSADDDLNINVDSDDPGDIYVAALEAAHEQDDD